MTHAGKLISDATACTKGISYPADLNLLNDSREKAEEQIDFFVTRKACEKAKDIQRKSEKRLF
jgi:hypothetical protein